MKVKTLSALAGLGGALIMSTAANAALVGLTVEIAPNVPGQNAGPGNATRYHVYANFTAGTDRVNAWGVGQNFGAGSISTTNGTNFIQFGGAGGQLAPYSPGTTRDWDTYMTIGVRYGADAPGGADATSQVPGTPTFIVGNTWTGDGVGVFITPDDAQGQANYNGSPNRVLLMQLTVAQGTHVQGTIGLAWNGIITTGLQFTSIPAPGALALLGLAGVVGGRRRRA